MQDSWGAYVKYAWGKDELDPVHQVGRDALGGLGATIVDSLDTLWLMGMKTEFYRCAQKLPALGAPSRLVCALCSTLQTDMSPPILNCSLQLAPSPH